MPTVGDRVKHIREHRHWTQEQLAELSGISKGFLSEIENNRTNPGSETVLKIADALGASIDYLLRGDESTSNASRKAVVIPPALAEAAVQLKLTYSETVELLEAHKSVVARRSDRAVKAFETKDWVDLYRAIKKVFG
jgi:transcriptional regulator with XRE-family HTH domain